MGETAVDTNSRIREYPLANEREGWKPASMARKNDPQRLPSGDIHPAYVKAALAIRGLTLTGLAKRHDKDPSYFRVALNERFPQGLRHIAKALGQQPYALWPTLFDEQNHAIKRRPGAVSTANHSTSVRARAVQARA